MNVTVREAARLVGKSEPTVHRWRNTNPHLFRAVIEYTARHKESEPSK